MANKFIWIRQVNLLSLFVPTWSKIEIGQIGFGMMLIGDSGGIQVLLPKSHHSGHCNSRFRWNGFSRTTVRWHQAIWRWMKTRNRTIMKRINRLQNDHKHTKLITNVINGTVIIWKYLQNVGHMQLLRLRRPPNEYSDRPLNLLHHEIQRLWWHLVAKSR